MTTLHDLIIVIHILSATLLFGTGLGTAFQMWMTHRSGDVRAIAEVSRNVVRADFFFTLPAVIVQPATGLALIRIDGYSLWEPWLRRMFSTFSSAPVGCRWCGFNWRHAISQRRRRPPARLCRRAIFASCAGGSGSAGPHFQPFWVFSGSW